MKELMAQLRWDWLRRRGDFLRPRHVPADVWRAEVKRLGLERVLQRAATGAYDRRRAQGTGERTREPSEHVMVTSRPREGGLSTPMAADRERLCRQRKSRVTVTTAARRQARRDRAM